MNERNLIYGIIEYGKEKNVFTIEELKSSLKLSDDDLTYVKHTLWHQRGITPSDPNHIIVTSSDRFRTDTYAKMDEPCRLLPSALFQYNDYLEIIEARKSAQEAKRLSWYAIWISIGLGVVQIIIGYLQLR